MAQGALFEEFSFVPEEQEIISQIRQQGYAPLPFELGRSACTDLFAGMSEFVELCDMPDGDKLKEAVTFKVNEDGNGGYHFSYRKPGTINPNETDRVAGVDHKYILHFGTQTIERAKSALGALPKEMDEFLANCNDYFHASARSMRIGAAALDLEGVAFGKSEESWVHHLRLIDYVASDEPLLGEAHFDRSLFTLANDESDTGLRGAPGQNGYLKEVSAEDVQKLKDSMRPISHFEHEAKFFLGAGYNRLPAQLRKHPNLPLLAHDIVNDRPGERRLAVVTFGNPTNGYPGYTVPKSAETGLDTVIEDLARAN